MAEFSKKYGNIIGSKTYETSLYATEQNTSRRPYKIAVFGDSRANTGSLTPIIGDTAAAIQDARAPGWLAAYMGDAEVAYNYGIGGDTASNWNNLARTSGKTVVSLMSTDADIVYVQYGVNDAMALTPADTIVGHLKGLCSQILYSGKFLVFDSIHPVNSPGTNYISATAIIKSVNAQMQKWISGLNGAVFVDSFSVLADRAGYALYAYTSPLDGIHIIRQGANVIGKLIADTIRPYFKKLTINSKNLLNIASPVTFTAIPVGTIAAGIQTASGVDADGFYTEWTWTPTALTSGECRAQLEMSANFQTAIYPYVDLSGNEVLQGSARIIINNPAGGAINCYSLALRQRFFTANILRDWGTFQAGSPNADTPNYDGVIDVLVTTPSFKNTVASVVANPGTASGYQLQVSVSSSMTGVPVRVRVYNAKLAVVGVYKPLEITPSASPYTYTNTANTTQTVYVSGGTVSNISVNTVATGLVDGQFVLTPGDVLAVTYTVAPGFVVK